MLKRTDVGRPLGHFLPYGYSIHDQKMCCIVKDEVLARLMAQEEGSTGPKNWRHSGRIPLKFWSLRKSQSDLTLFRSLQHHYHHALQDMSASTGLVKSTNAPALKKKKNVITYPFWFGGSSSSLAACVTHPLDLSKLIRQTRRRAPSLLIFGWKLTWFYSQGIYYNCS